jgi:ABC-2 type transport system permease protein
VTYAAPGAPPVGSVDRGFAAETARLISRIGTLCWVEMRKIRHDRTELYTRRRGPGWGGGRPTPPHDRTELYTRAIQPALWLLIYGEVFTRVHAIPTPAGIPYLAYLAPGIMAQSALFIAIFYGIQIIWERDAGVLTKLMVTPTPRSALITGKAFASSVRSLIQGVVVIIIAALLGVSFTDNPLRLIAALAILALGSAFFSCLSMTLAGVVVARDRLMGIGQAITMPLFFSSSALYPTKIMPGWLQVISRINPLTYEVEALRGLLIGTETTLWLDVAVLVGATVLAITGAAMLLPRLANR